MRGIAFEYRETFEIILLPKIAPVKRAGFQYSILKLGSIKICIRSESLRFQLDFFRLKVNCSDKTER